MGKHCTNHAILYCMKCGNKGIPIIRRNGREKKSGHRKNLYCIFCKGVVGHIECKNMLDVEKFKEDFANGVYKEEAEISFAYCLEKENNLLFRGGDITK